MPLRLKRFWTSSPKLTDFQPTLNQTDRLYVDFCRLFDKELHGEELMRLGGGGVILSERR
jgi:hypothetical protein